MRKLFRNNSGFTLVELIVVMAIFIMVIIITTDSFNRILVNAKKLFSSEESNIEGVIGLEMMRHDLEQAGYGLPWVSMDGDLNLPDYSEAAGAPHNTSLPCGSAAAFNCYNDGKGAGSQIPRAVVAGNNVASADGIIAGTDYLGIKATSLGTSDTVKKWTFVRYSSNLQPKPNIWASASENLNENESVIFTRRELTTINDREVFASKLLYYDSTKLTQRFHTANVASEDTSVDKILSPQNSTQQHIIYGIAGSNTARFPFNRANYFVKVPSAGGLPTRCAPNTGVLYKGSVNQSDGAISYIPLLDCVADMQVTLGWDFTGDKIDTWSDANGTNVSSPSGITSSQIQQTLADPSLLRERLRTVKVYFLVQEGRKDPGYITPAPLDVGNRATSYGTFSDISLTKSYTAAQITANGWTNYRWKLYRLVVSPKNLISNQ